MSSSTPSSGRPRRGPYRPRSPADMLELKEALFGRDGRSEPGPGGGRPAPPGVPPAGPPAMGPRPGRIVGFSERDSRRLRLYRRLPVKGGRPFLVVAARRDIRGYPITVRLVSGRSGTYRGRELVYPGDAEWPITVVAEPQADAVERTTYFVVNQSHLYGLSYSDFSATASPYGELADGARRIHDVLDTTPLHFLALDWAAERQFWLSAEGTS